MNHLIIRADATAKIGAGHVLRCLALAEAWVAKGGTVDFAGRCESSELWLRIVRTINGKATRFRTQADDDFEWACDDLDRKWVVLDGYDFSPWYQEQLFLLNHNMLVIDDYSHLPKYHCDLLLNYSCSATPEIYAGKVAPDTKLLLGPQYALIRREFDNIGKHKLRRCFPLGVVLVTTGGGDNHDSRLVMAIQELPQARVYQPYDFKNWMPGVMAAADIVICAGGVTSYEAAFMGLPAIIIATADNQVPSAKALHKLGVAEYLGPLEEVSDEQIRDAVRELLDDPARRRMMSEAGMALVDGKGAERVVEAILYIGVRDANV